MKIINKFIAGALYAAMVVALVLLALSAFIFPALMMQQYGDTAAMITLFAEIIIFGGLFNALFGD